MNYGDINFFDTVNGTGIRVTLWVSGCRNHCKGCFNKDTWDFSYGREFTEIEENEILEACKKPYMHGLTILGGEPFEEENQPAVLRLVRLLKETCPGKNVWIYTGYILEKDLCRDGRKHIAGITDEILKNVDTLIDGPFIESQKDLTLKFRGSKNQRLLDKSEIEKICRRYEN